MGRRAFIGAGVCVAAVVAATALASSAVADHRGLNPEWPQLLPGSETVADGAPQSVERCRRVGIRCVDRLIARLRRQWERLDADCDGRGVAALAYARINQALRHDLARQESLFRHKHWFERVLTTFSNRYFEAFRRYERGRPVPAAWRIAFDAQTGEDISAAQEVLLFSNAHVQRDLPFAYAEIGLVTADGRSRKHDHDAFNEINNRILDPVGDEIARRYDPTFPLIDLRPIPFDEISSQETVKLWRELAWRNAERLARADDALEWNAAAADIERSAAGWAAAIAASRFPGLRAARDDYCRTQRASGAAGPFSRR